MLPLGVVNGKMLLTANNGSNGYELWITDGTEFGTFLLKDINPGAAGSDPSTVTVLDNGLAVFTASDATAGRELWVTDGTAAGTMMLSDISG